MKKNPANAGFFHHVDTSPPACTWRKTKRLIPSPSAFCLQGGHPTLPCCSGHQPGSFDTPMDINPQPDMSRHSATAATRRALTR
jgi:hypothetical protein